MSKSTTFKPKLFWASFWMRLSGPGPGGRLATRLASLFTRPYRARYRLAKLSTRGYLSPSASLSHSQLKLGSYCFIGDRVIIFEAKGGGTVDIHDDVHINQDCILETGEGGHISVGEGTRIQGRCQLSAYKGPIRIGRNALVAPSCAFYPYDHEFTRGQMVKHQSFRSRGGIVIGDDVWIGFGVIVLDGATIGDGAIVGAGSVVRSTIPENAIAVGTPARVVGYRKDPGEPAES